MSTESNDYVVASPGLRYLGATGGTKDCVEAVATLLQTLGVRSAILLSHIGERSGQHGFLLEIGTGDQLIIPPGFTSGYRGEGPNGLSYAICLLESFKVPTQEVEITAATYERLEAKQVSSEDLDYIEKANKRRDRLFGEYVFEKDSAALFNGTLWRQLSPILPVALVEPALFDLVPDFFIDPDRALISGYRRLEDSVREKTGLKDSAQKLMSASFIGEKSRLCWSDLDPSEQLGRAQLFTGAYMAFRNRRAHKELDRNSSADTHEFLLLNLLFSLLNAAVERVETKG